MVWHCCVEPRRHLRLLFHKALGSLVAQRILARKVEIVCSKKLSEVRTFLDQWYFLPDYPTLLVMWHIALFVYFGKMCNCQVCPKCGEVIPCRKTSGSPELLIGNELCVCCECKGGLHTSQHIKDTLELVSMTVGYRLLCGYGMLHTGQSESWI